jgi:hypothetical protein
LKGLEASLSPGCIQKNENDNEKEGAGSSLVYVEPSLIEKKFWEMVHSTFNPVEVEYGADLHTTLHGR